MSRFSKGARSATCWYDRWITAVKSPAVIDSFGRHAKLLDLQVNNKKTESSG